MFKTNRMLWSRVFGIVVLAYIVVAAPPTYFGTFLAELCEVTGFFLLAVATLGRLWSLVFIAGKKNETLLTEGPYSVVRNPLYVFNFLGGIGFGLAVENPWLACLTGICFVIYYPYTVAHEEKYLTSAFGSAYADYCAKTPRWVPNLRLYREPNVLIVYPRHVRHGILDAMWFLWAFLLWEVLEELRQAGILHTWL